MTRGRVRPARAGVGGRIMMTSLNLLTLEVYYRYLPLYYRDAGYGKDKAVQKAFDAGNK